MFVYVQTNNIFYYFYFFYFYLYFWFFFLFKFCFNKLQWFFYEKKTHNVFLILYKNSKRLLSYEMNSEVKLSLRHLSGLIAVPNQSIFINELGRRSIWKFQIFLMYVRMNYSLHIQTYVHILQSALATYVYVTSSTNCLHGG